MRKVLLVDVDSKIPNIALMKLSTYYKNKKYDVELIKLKYSGYPEKKKKTTIIDCSIYEYDIVFVSIIFTVNKKTVDVNNCKNVYYGGSGYDLSVKLPKVIDDCEEDYSIYPSNDTSYGFITRGCIRNCKFCFVPKKEGYLKFYRHPKDVIKHKKVRFLDNNILAYGKHIDVFKYLISNRVKVSFNEGLDIRLINSDNARYLSQLSYFPSNYVFAFDDVKYKKTIENKIKIIKKYIQDDWKIKMYIYTHPNQSIKDSVLERITWCKQNKVLPYVMRDYACWKSKNREFYVDLASYCNQPNLFKKMSFEDFMYKRTTNRYRQENSINLYYSKKN